MRAEDALIQAKSYTKKSLEGAGAIKGQDGVSPTVDITKTDGIITISITDKNDTHTATIVDGQEFKDLIEETDAKHITLYSSISSLDVTTPNTLSSIVDAMGKNALLECETTTSVVTNLPADGILQTRTDQYGNKKTTYLITPTCYYIGKYVGSGQYEWVKSTDEALSLNGGTINGDLTIDGTLNDYNIFNHTDIDVADKLTNTAYTGTSSPYFHIHVYEFGSFAIMRFNMHNVTFSSSSNIDITLDGTEEYYDLLSSFTPLCYVLPSIVNTGGPAAGYDYLNGDVILNRNTSQGKFSGFTLKFPNQSEDKTVSSYPRGTTAIGYIEK